MTYPFACPIRSSPSTSASNSPSSCPVNPLAQTSERGLNEKLVGWQSTCRKTGEASTVPSGNQPLDANPKTPSNPEGFLGRAFTS